MKNKTKDQIIASYEYMLSLEKNHYNGLARECEKLNQKIKELHADKYNLYDRIEQLESKCSEDTLEFINGVIELMGSKYNKLCDSQYNLREIKEMLK